jgi:hypothetical protein
MLQNHASISLLLFSLLVGQASLKFYLIETNGKDLALDNGLTSSPSAAGKQSADLPR